MRTKPSVHMAWGPITDQVRIKPAGKSPPGGLFNLPGEQTKALEISQSRYERLGEILRARQAAKKRKVYVIINE